MENFEDVATFCATADGDGDTEKGARIQRLRDTIANDVSRAYLKFELGVVGIVGKNMIQATCNLEGNKCCSLLAYTRSSNALTNSMRTMTISLFLVCRMLSMTA